MDNRPPAQGPSINIELREKEAEGIYSNLALISHSPSEVIIYFARVLPGTQKSRVYARVVMTQSHAKSLLQALDTNLKNYESSFGKIKVFGGGDSDTKEIGFASASS